MRECHLNCPARRGEPCPGGPGCKGERMTYPPPVLVHTAEAVTYLVGNADKRGRRLATYRLFNWRRRGLITGYLDKRGAILWDLRELHTLHNRARNVV